MENIIKKLKNKFFKLIFIVINCMNFKFLKKNTVTGHTGFKALG